jgi:CHASE2 domain-containing sensor protein
MERRGRSGGIDERTEQAIKRKFDTSWRAEHATLISNAASAAARVVAFDLVLEDEGSADANAALERSLSAARDKMQVVFGVQRNAGNGTGLMLAQFAPLVRQGINCAGTNLGQTGSMPLAVRRVDTAASASDGRALDKLTPSFGLAAFSGGGRVELVDEHTQKATVQLRRQQKSQAISYYSGETIDDPQPACDVIAKGDRVFNQLIDPFVLPPLRTPPQRVAYENVVAGDPATLALLKNRIVLVGALLPGIDMIPLPWPAQDRWGVELFATQIDAMARDFAIHRIGPVTELVLITSMALLGAFTVHRMRHRSRIARTMVLLSIAVVFVIFAIAWYRFERRTHRRTLRSARTGTRRLAGAQRDGEEADVNPSRTSSLWRVTAWAVIVAMLLPTVVACTTPIRSRPPHASTASWSTATGSPERARRVLRSSPATARAKRPMREWRCSPGTGSTLGRGRMQ